MNRITVDMTEAYTARARYTHELMGVPAQRMARIVAQAYDFGLTVEIKDSTRADTQYIQISDGKGSSYGQYFIGADFRDRYMM
ncbi:hypothetical protein [Kitasatospora sp. NPDC001132]